MKKLIFALHDITSLREELSRGFAQISFASAAHRRPISITLRRSDGTGLRVRCRMHDVAERVEYGVLEFEIIGTLQRRVSVPPLLALLEISLHL